MKIPIKWTDVRYCLSISEKPRANWVSDRKPRQFRVGMARRRAGERGARA